MRCHRVRTEEAGVKKVRYVMGAVGVLGAVPALGALAPVAGAAVAPGGTAGYGARAVSPRSASTSVNTACPGQSRKTTHSGTGVNRFNGTAWGVVGNGWDCVRQVSGKLDHSQVSLLMRVRTYHNGAQKQWPWVHGHIGTGDTTFSMTFPGFGVFSVSQVCEALVYASDHAVAYGPVCQD
jgi:hypothetical protein